MGVVPSEYLVIEVRECGDYKGVSRHTCLLDTIKPHFSSTITDTYTLTSHGLQFDLKAFQLIFCVV